MSGIRKYLVCGRRKEKDMEMINESIHDIIHFLNVAPMDKRTEVVLAPPETYVTDVVSQLTRAQVTVAADHCGAGSFDALSAQKVKDRGSQWVILGHMERRKIVGDIYQGIKEEIRAAMEAGLKVMVCVGETLSEREAVQTLEVVTRQLHCIAEGVEDWGGVVVVYQPLWAVDTCKKITTLEVVRVFKAIRQWMADSLYPPSIAVTTRIVYGGPVCGNNCAELAIKEDIDGFLVEGSAISYDLLRIINARM